jgi:hypothetical protein
MINSQTGKKQKRKSRNRNYPRSPFEKGRLHITLKELTKDRVYEPAGDYSFAIGRHDLCLGWKLCSVITHFRKQWRGF